MKTEEYIATLKQGLIDTQSALHSCRMQLEETNRRKNIKIKELEDFIMKHAEAINESIEAKVRGEK
jgi:hypothetical protein